MDEPINVTTEYIGVIEGMRTWLVKNDVGEIIGKDESPESIEEPTEVNGAVE